ncbi:gliding motility-associated peptidyl-prolyl isomerase GldI [Lutibacter sp.]|uniref:gliding motility-associated peptidyl-prolyl isomerase GldI n=1 Tax=Lutibacter sp. TaxID=1925666 RepID=UPI003562E7D7
MKYKYFLYIFLVLLVSCANPIPRKPVLRKTSTFLNESVTLNKAMNASEENGFRTLMEKDSLNKYLASPNGFWYTFNRKNEDSYLPKIGDQLFYTYDVFDTNNHLIYSAEEVGELTYIVDKQEIVEGLRNGLKLMSAGDVVTFLFPSHKAYGYTGDSNKIEINQPLIFKIQLIKINKKNESN